MKKLSNPVLNEDQYKKLTLVCMIPDCKKNIEGWYATFGNSGVCSRKHMLQQNKKIEEEQRVAYEAFCKKFNLSY